MTMSQGKCSNSITSLKPGFAAPQVTYIMKELREHGYDVGDEVTTIEEAKQEILAYFRER